MGPPLGEIGKKERAYLLQALVDPQGTIAPGYGMITLTRRDGSAAAGALLEEKDGGVVLLQPDGGKVVVPHFEIETKTVPISAMPPVAEILKPGELRNLLEYLASLK